MLRIVGSEREAVASRAEQGIAHGHGVTCAIDLLPCHRRRQNHLADARGGNQLVLSIGVQCANAIDIDTDAVHIGAWRNIKEFLRMFARRMHRDTHARPSFSEISVRIGIRARSARPVAGHKSPDQRVRRLRASNVHDLRVDETFLDGPAVSRRWGLFRSAGRRACERVRQFTIAAHIDCTCSRSSDQRDARIGLAVVLDERYRQALEPFRTGLCWR
jgi:hypothetical protein